MKFIPCNAILGSILAVTAIVSSGCSGRPDGYPDIYPCEIDVRNAGAPEKDVLVLLRSEESDRNVGCSYSGVTDANGAAKIHTFYRNYSAPGLPEGRFRVTLFKEKEIEFEEVSDLVVEKWPDAERLKYYDDIEKAKAKAGKLIPGLINDFETTTLNLEVKAKTGGKLSVDLGELFKEVAKISSGKK